MAQAKKDFAWTSTEVIGFVPVSEKKKVEVSINSLEMANSEGEEERWYVSLTTSQLFKKKGMVDVDWHITKNATFPVDVFSQIVEMVEDNLDKLE